MRKDVSMVLKKIDSVNKELKPLGSTVQKKEKEYKEALDTRNKKNRGKVQLITKLMETIALKNKEFAAEERMEALKYLKDIKWNRFEEPKRFTLELLFDKNPYFENSLDIPIGFSQRGFLTRRFSWHQSFVMVYDEDEVVS